MELCLVQDLPLSEKACVLPSVAAKALWPHSAHAAEEDERLARAVAALWRTHPEGEDGWRKWLHALPAAALNEPWPLRVNRKNFLRSLYFRLVYEGIDVGYAEAISDILRKADPYALPADCLG